MHYPLNIFLYIIKKKKIIKKKIKKIKLLKKNVQISMAISMAKNSK